MEIHREGNKFRPITIVLENQEEADAMWAMMTCGDFRTMHEYAYNMQRPWILGARAKMSTAFQERYNINED